LRIVCIVTKEIKINFVPIVPLVFFASFVSSVLIALSAITPIFRGIVEGFQIPLFVMIVWDAVIVLGVLV